MNLPPSPQWELNWSIGVRNRATKVLSAKQQNKKDKISVNKVVEISKRLLCKSLYHRLTTHSLRWESSFPGTECNNQDIITRTTLGGGKRSDVKGNDFKIQHERVIGPAQANFSR